jgi:hypothetical protein
MHRLREYIARIDGSRWILLSQRLKGNWAFLIWGAEPLSGNLNLVDEQTAKVQVASVAEQHFAHDEPARRMCGSYLGVATVSW